VVFKLRHAQGSQGEKDFLEALLKLSEIPGVENMHLSREISKKNKFEYHVSMEFADQAAYDRYNNHPNHVSFVQQRWMKEVEDFLEIDYEIRN
jgi:heme-degrading monooxygenase HmoA